MYNQGCKFDKNENVEEIYAYIGVNPKTEKAEVLLNNVVQGEKHKYVVPERQVSDKEQEIESEFDDDYSSLTMQDLKLLLRSENIPFDNTLSKEELLELVDKYIVETPELDVPKVNEKNKFQNMTIAQIIEELKLRNIEYKNSMKKDELIKLLIEDDIKGE